MTDSNKLGIAVSVFLVGVIAIAGVTFLQSMLSGGSRDRGEARLGSASIVSIIEGRAVILIDKSEFQQVWEFASEAVLYERGDYPIRGSSQTIDLGSPAGTFVVTTDSRFDVREGAAYTLVLDATGRGGEKFPESFDWYAKAVLTDTGEPIDGTPESLVLDLEAIQLPTDSTLETALIEFAIETESYGRERDALEESGASSDEVTIGVRYQAILDQEIAISDGSAAVIVDNYLDRQDIDRQLPLDFQEVEQMPTAVRDALGMSEFVSWNVEVVYDHATSELVEWYGLLFEGVGFIGPSSSDQGFTSVDGVGPAQGRIRLVTWGHGVPEQAFTGMSTTDRPDSEAIVQGSLHDLGLDPSVKSTIPEDGALVVTMRLGKVALIQILDADEYRRFLESFSGVDSQVPGESG